MKQEKKNLPVAQGMSLTSLGPFFVALPQHLILVVVSH
jgi:hypothetical protein